MTETQLSERLESACQETFSQMMQASDAIYGLLISTVDGHDVAKNFKKDLPAAKMAAMMGSMLALGETVATEAKQKLCRYVIVENSDGFILTLKIKGDLVLSVIASANANLGMLHSISRNAVEKLAAQIR